MDQWPRIGDMVRIAAPAHPLEGRSGEVASYHGKLEAVFVCVAGVDRPQLVPICYLEKERIDE